MAKLKRSWNQKYSLAKQNYGEGGNAVVHIVKDIYGNRYALKELVNCSIEKKARFIDEIHVMNENSDLAAIMPIIDFSEEEYWYVMPIAIPILNVINVKEDFKTVQAIIYQMAEGLKEIHARNLAHRDIKPDNIYMFNDHVCYGDFGLVEFPDNPNDFTRSDHGLGAIFTIAPEMKRNPKGADGKKADIYSFAKTIWILLMGEPKGFDGSYSIVDKVHNLRTSSDLKKYHLVELENLLSDATADLPEDRPDAIQLTNRIRGWIEVFSDEDKSQKSEWEFLQKCIFPQNHPESACWSNMEDVISILNLINSLPVYNHMIFSDKGGLDFVFSEKANEEGLKYMNRLGFSIL